MFQRNTLMVGPRGTGKSLLLIYLASQSLSDTIYISLIEALGSAVTNMPPSEAPPLNLPQSPSVSNARAVSLLALAIIAELYRRGSAPPLEAVAPFFPLPLRAQNDDSLTSWPSLAKTTLEKPSANELFRSFSPPNLHDLLYLLGNQFADKGLRLKIYFDRADMLPPPLVAPVLDLLDQGGPYLAVIATRPAPNADPDWGKRPPVVPTDHYDVMALGNAPRDIAWKNFVKDAISAQFPNFQRRFSLPEEAVETIVHYARDSLKLALEITHQLRFDHRTPWHQRLRPILASRQRRLLERMGARLKVWEHDFGATARRWRQEILVQNRVSSVDRPVRLRITAPRELPLFDATKSPARWERFVAACLEEGVLHAPHAEFWYPGRRLREVEIAPLLIWSEEDPDFLREDTLLHLRMSPSTLLGPLGRAGLRKGKTFVAVRFDFPPSLLFFRRLKEALAGHPMLADVKALHGRDAASQDWAKDIRATLLECTLPTVGDVTGGRGDVLFELGCAFGLGRVIIPVVESKPALSECPFWLRSWTIWPFETEEDLRAIINHLYEQLYTSKYQRRRRLPDPVPHRAAFVGRYDWNDHALDQIAHLARQERVEWSGENEVDESNYDTALDVVARARTLVIALDGTQADEFAYWACGMAVARPSVGMAGPTLNRRVLVVRESAATPLPDSITRAQPHVSVLDSPTDLSSHFSDATQEYKDWIKTAPTMKAL